MFLLITGIVILAWLIYNIFRIYEAFGSSTSDKLYYFDIDTITKRQKGVYTVDSFPANATAINDIKFFTRIVSGGDDNRDAYSAKPISGDTIDTGGTSVQFRSPSFNSKGQYKGFLSIHGNQKQISSMNTDNSIGLPCNITQQGTIMGTSKMPGSEVLQVSGISKANFNNPIKKSRKGNNVMMKINYKLSD